MRVVLFISLLLLGIATSAKIITDARTNRENAFAKEGIHIDIAGFSDFDTIYRLAPIIKIGRVKYDIEKGEVVGICDYLNKRNQSVQLKYFIEAYDSIKHQLQTLTTPKLIDIVYFAENARMENKLIKKQFYQSIKDYAMICKNYSESGNVVYHGKDSIAVFLQASVYALMHDSITFYINSEIRKVKFFEDYMENDRYNNSVVSLMLSGRGNSISRSIFFALIMEELNQPYNIADYPLGLYVKLRNEAIGCYNVDLITESYPTEAQLMCRYDIILDTIRNGVYLRSLSKQQLIAEVLFYLMSELHINDVTIKAISDCSELIQKYYPEYVNLLLLQLELVLQKNNISSVEEAQKIADISVLCNQIYELGYTNNED